MAIKVWRRRREHFIVSAMKFFSYILLEFALHVDNDYSSRTSSKIVEK